jgi:hypothetical protein
MCSRYIHGIHSVTTFQVATSLHLKSFPPPMLHHWKVCVLFCFIKPILGNCFCVLICFIKPTLGSRYGPGVSSRVRARGTHPRSKIADVPPRPVPPYITSGVRILILHLNYVAGCTNPLFFLFKWVHNYYLTKACTLAAPLCGRVQRSFGLICKGPEW